MKFITVALVLNFAQVGGNVAPETKTAYIKVRDITAVKETVVMKYSSPYENEMSEVRHDACLVEINGKPAVVEWNCEGLIDDINKASK